MVTQMRMIFSRSAHQKQMQIADEDTITDGRQHVCCALHAAALCLFFARPDSYDEALLHSLYEVPS
jgi:hypothetical protein